MSTTVQSGNALGKIGLAWSLLTAGQPALAATNAVAAPRPSVVAERVLSGDSSLDNLTLRFGKVAIGHGGREKFTQ